MHILHLSDLHLGTQKDAHLWAGQLADDLKYELGCSQLDAMIITGDVANFAVKEEYDAAESFIKRVCQEFGIPAANLAIVPGNHDLNWDLSEDGYIPIKRKKYQGKLEEGSYIEESDALVQIRDDKAYEERFAPFGVFFEKVTQSPYPLSCGQQGLIHHFKDLDLLILGSNSAWLVDHHFRSRAAICPDALAAALDAIRQNPYYARCLKFAVWHHPLVSPFEDRITDLGFMERLAQGGFCVCFHGHLHKTETGLFRYDISPGGAQNRNRGRRHLRRTNQGVDSRLSVAIQPARNLPKADDRKNPLPHRNQRRLETPRHLGPEPGPGSAVQLHHRFAATAIAKTKAPCTRRGREKLSAFH